MCERWELPFDIQQKGVTPVSTVLRAATGIVTLCTVDVVVVWVWVTTLILTLQNSHSQAYFYHCPRVTSNHRQFWDGHHGGFLPWSLGHRQFSGVVTRSRTVFGWSQIISLHGLSSKYGNMRLTLQCLQVFFTKL